MRPSGTPPPEWTALKRTFALVASVESVGCCTGPVIAKSFASAGSQFSYSLHLFSSQPVYVHI